MAKGERKRRRRDGEELTALGEDVIVTGASAAGMADSSGTITEMPLTASPAKSAAALSLAEEELRLSSIPSSPSRPARKLQMRPLGVPSSLDSSSAGESISGAETAAAAEKPVALAQILTNPSFGARAKPVPRAEKLPAPMMKSADPQPERLSNGDLRNDAMRLPEKAIEEPEPPFQAPYIPRHSYRAERDEEPKRWTREPVLVALLLVGLIMLAFNSYATLRMNGMSDRLSAIGTQPAAIVPVSGAERPWVGVDTIRTQPFASGGQPVTTVHIVNSGREPAYDLRSNTVGSLRSAATPPPDIPAQKGPLATTGLLLPNTGGNLTFFGNTRALTAQEANSVRSGQYVLWLAGRLDYKDAKGRLHATTFRYRYDPNLNSFIAAPAGNLAN